MKQILFCIFLSVTGVVFSQNKSELAESNVKKAVKLIDDGFPDEAIALLQQAKRLDKDNYIYDYEIGYAYFLKEEYKSSLIFYEKAVKYKNSNDQCFQMLGNLLDISGKPEEALKTYDKGLKKFPKSGRLYLEKGNVFWNQQKYLEAIRFYEDGIAAEPRFPSNYYRATLIYCNSAEPVWGMIYGEIFMNLEKNSKRTAEISKMLYDTYKNQIQILDDTVKVRFSKMNKVISNVFEDSITDQIPFGIGVYEPILLISIGKVTAININTLDSIRSNF
ncbi:MAG: tetratricopeptide repeat protein, partial [Bacteroidales bacterium]|nr:tetratricopeptide repeat protein [Bacteroidales bacterium]